MIDLHLLRQYAKSHQTSELNVAREYCQHLFLSAFYRQKGTQRVLFKGGTALRLVYGSPRFSEDLDFSGFGVTPHDIEAAVVDAAAELEQMGITINLQESKRTSGGYLRGSSLHPSGIGSARYGSDSSILMKTFAPSWQTFYPRAIGEFYET